MGSNAVLGALVSGELQMNWMTNVLNSARTLSLVAVMGVSLSTLAVPASAQIDISGSWAARNYSDPLSNNPGPETGPADYLGMPYNDAGRAWALSYSYSQISMPDRACAFYSPAYIGIGPFGLKIWNETEPRNGATVAWVIGGWEDTGVLRIWMDGRPHPSPNAIHPMSGFSTGKWEGDVLTIRTTHMRVGILRRNGAPHSDQATMLTRLMRHGDIMTMTIRIDDPLYLTEPYYLTRTFQLSSVNPIRTVGQPCTQANEGVPEGVVPHFLPGQNPFLRELENTYGIPSDAAMGGAETAFPDFRKKIKDRYKAPAKCPRVCGGPGAFPLRAG
ncbi:MAG: hypothetical protein ABL995_07585 [Bryobacteraceae bacterium]